MLFIKLTIKFYFILKNCREIQKIRKQNLQLIRSKALYNIPKLSCLHPFCIYKMLLQNENNKQAIEKQTIQVIAHRGLSSVFPQNTKQAIVAGLHCADLVQFDVLLTKDDEVIVFHDRGLKRLTNIEELEVFKDRVKEESIENDKKSEKNWWVRDFTYEELSKLVVKQPHKHRPQLPQHFKISTLSQIIQQSLKTKGKKFHVSRLKSGLLIELKQQIVNKTTERDFHLCKKVLQILHNFGLDSIQGCKKKNLPVILQSFSIPMVKWLEPQCGNKMVQLYKKDLKITEELLIENRGERFIGIGITQQSLLDSNGKVSTRVRDICHKLGYRLFYWTIRDDDMQKIPFGCTDYASVYKTLHQNGVNGFITEFPDYCKAILKIPTVMYTTDPEQIAQKCLRRQSSKNQQLQPQPHSSLPRTQ